VDNRFSRRCPCGSHTRNCHQQERKHRSHRPTGRPKARRREASVPVRASAIRPTFEPAVLRET
jgi:hypothetical protein